MTGNGANKYRMAAQKTIMKRCGVVQITKGKSKIVNIEKFQAFSTRFAMLEKKGLNYIQIEKELR